MDLSIINQRLEQIQELKDNPLFREYLSDLQFDIERLTLSIVNADIENVESFFSREQAIGALAATRGNHTWFSALEAELKQAKQSITNED